MFPIRIAPAFLVSFLPGCFWADWGGPPSADRARDTGANLSLEDTGDTPGAPESVAPWTVSSHPCMGNRTDGFLFDDPWTGFVGCGSTPDGTGVYGTTDGGLSWSPVVADADSFLDTFRVMHLSRRPSGQLALAGIHAGGDHRVVALDTRASPPVLEELFAASGESWRGFTAGSYAELPSGLAVAEPLTGNNVAFRMDSSEPWQSGYGWWNEGGHQEQQILDLAAHGDGMYGCGSTVAQPPVVFLPPHEPGRFGFEVVSLATGVDSYRGELWSLDVDAAGIVVGGVNQDAGAGMVYVSGADLYQGEAWRALDASTVVLDPEEPTWIRGVCRAGADLVAVGEYSRLGEGLVLRSRDNGFSWRDETAGLGTNVPALQRCQVFSDGTVVVAGAEGFFARHEAPYPSGGFRAVLSVPGRPRTP